MGGPARRVADKVQPGYVEVPLRRLFPPGRLIDGTKIDVSITLVPGITEVEELSPSDAVGDLLAVTYRELELEDSLYDYALAGVLDLPAHWERAIRVNAEFLGSVPRVLRVPVPARADPRAEQARLLELLRDLAERSQ